jgi:hypothetical protein
MRVSSLRSLPLPPRLFDEIPHREGIILAPANESSMSINAQGTTLVDQPEGVEVPLTFS